MKFTLFSIEIEGLKVLKQLVGTLDYCVNCLHFEACNGWKNSDFIVDWIVYLWDIYCPLCLEEYTD